MRQGVLVHDPKQDRMDVRFGLDEFYGGLHCGQPLDIWLKAAGIRRELRNPRTGI